MRKLLLLALLIWPVFSLGQRVQVSAIVQDINSSPYSNCTGNASFRGQNTTPGAGPYLLNGSTFQTQVPVFCDSSGHFSVTLSDNNQISPTPSQWNFSLCSALGYTGGPYCFNVLLTITGTTQSITGNIIPLAPILPPLGGAPAPGGTIGQVQVRGPSNILVGTSPIYVTLVTGTTNNDIGDKINTAYLGCPSTGCVLYIPPGSYNFTTPIVASTVNKPVVIQCGYGSNSNGPTLLNYTATTGTAITLAAGAASALKGCTLTGTANNNSAVGLSLSNTTGSAQTQAVIEANSISLFGTCVLFGNNTYLDSFRENSFFNCTKVLNYPSTVTGSGEDIVFNGGLLQGIIGSYSATCADFEANAETISFTGVSFDSCGITLNATGINFNMSGGNLENLGSTTTTDFLSIGSSCTQCSTTLTGVNVQEDGNGAGRGHLITNGANGSKLNIIGGKYFPGSEGAIAALVNTVSGSATWVGNIQSSNITTPVSGSGAFGWNNIGNSITLNGNLTMNGNNSHLAVGTVTTGTDYAPFCSMTSGTCHYTFLTGWGFPPNCVGSWNGQGNLTGFLQITSSTAQVVATSSVNSDTAQIAMICVGEPN